MLFIICLSKQVSDAFVDGPARHPQPTLMSLVVLHRSSTKALERAVEEKSVMLSKVLLRKCI